VESFLLQEAEKAGVVRVTKKSRTKNPNRWEKHMAPWYDEHCKNARARYRRAVKTNGRDHAHTIKMFKTFVTTCK
jgi:hypothetical protein